MLCLLVLIFSAAIVSVFFFSNSCSTSLLIGCFASHVIPVLWSCSASSPSISCNRFQVNSTSRMPPVHADVVLKDNQLPSLTLALPQFIIHSRSVSPDDGLYLFSSRGRSGRRNCRLSRPAKQLGRPRLPAITAEPPPASHYGPFYYLI